METGRAEGTLSLRRQTAPRKATTDGEKKGGDNEMAAHVPTLRTTRRWERQRQVQAHPSFITGCAVNTATSQRTPLGLLRQKRSFGRTGYAPWPLYQGLMSKGFIPRPTLVRLSFGSTSDAPWPLYQGFMGRFILGLGEGKRTQKSLSGGIGERGVRWRDPQRRCLQDSSLGCPRSLGPATYDDTASEPCVERDGTERGKLFHQPTQRGRWC